VTEASVNFDRAAAVYDSTRRLPPAAERELINVLAAELGDRGSCLEVGVGTGRLAVPLRRGGIDMYGCDISVGMLTELLRKGEDGPMPFVTIADATALPFDDKRFGAALASHVFHLVSDWERAARELHRVVEPGGVICVSLGGLELPRMRALRQRLLIESGKTSHPGLTDPEAFERLMRSLGTTQRFLAPVARGERSTLRAQLEWMENNGSAITWDLDDATRIAAVQAVREWAAREIGDLDSTYVDEEPIVVRAYQLS
jgi:SAM-dependent methyltransferase